MTDEAASATTGTEHGVAPATAGGMPRQRGAFGPGGYLVVFGGLAVLVAVLVGAGVWAVGRMGDAPALPDGIQFVLPPQGGAMMSQDRVGVQTQQSWACTLTIDGIRLPESQYSGVKELGECYFQAGQGRMIEEFAPGRHRVEVTVYPQSNPESTQTYNWFFQTQ